MHIYREAGQWVGVRAQAIFPLHQYICTDMCVISTYVPIYVYMMYLYILHTNVIYPFITCIQRREEMGETTRSRHHVWHIYTYKYHYISLHTYIYVCTYVQRRGAMGGSTRSRHLSLKSTTNPSGIVCMHTIRYCMYAYIWI